MIRLQDFLEDPDLEKKYNKRLLDRMRDPAQAEWLIRNYLMQPGDRIYIEETPVPPGIQVSYTITEPSGRWQRLHFLKRNAPGNPRPEEIRWVERERKRIQYRQRPSQN